MAHREATATVDARFSSDNAAAPAWDDVVRLVRDSRTYWLTTVRRDGRPHTTTLLSIWLDGVPYFCTGLDEQKTKNLEHNQHCILMTGCNGDAGLDVVVEGRAVRETDEDRLIRLAAGWEEKYGEEWHFDVRDGAFHAGGNSAAVFAVVPDKILTFAKGETYSQTRWTYPV
ncbi:pyridoxamine 5'-phosphate oxidase family protein [Thermoactinospora rubra]|uniref:pyridoxamine 5'-phosphate oxidase family protein n=1 Tax=Thermoactinospora rubra TaxID=1088767 RepID=UPI000A11C4B8|nr:pyridoxamine 5'-phosphate oxidase family protein [Thermoactinospora rubra]